MSSLLPINFYSKHLPIYLGIIFDLYSKGTFLPAMQNSQLVWFSDAWGHGVCFVMWENLKLWGPESVLSRFIRGCGKGSSWHGLSGSNQYQKQKVCVVLLEHIDTFLKAGTDCGEASGAVTEVMCLLWWQASRCCDYELEMRKSVNTETKFQRRNSSWFSLEQIFPLDDLARGVVIVWM